MTSPAQTPRGEVRRRATIGLGWFEMWGFYLNLRLEKAFHAHRLFYESNKSTPSEKGPSDLLWNCINETLEHNRRKTFWAFFFQLFVFIDTESLSWSSTPVTTLESVAVAPMYKSHLLSVSYSISVFLKMQWKVGYIYTLYICVDICSYIVWYISAENTRHLDTFEILTRINRCANENTR